LFIDVLLMERNNTSAVHFFECPPLTCASQLPGLCVSIGAALEKQPWMCRDTGKEPVKILEMKVIAAELCCKMASFTMLMHPGKQAWFFYFIGCIGSSGQFLVNGQLIDSGITMSSSRFEKRCALDEWRTMLETAFEHMRSTWVAVDASQYPTTYYKKDAHEHVLFLRNNNARHDECGAIQLLIQHLSLRSHVKCSDEWKDVEPPHSLPFRCGSLYMWVRKSEYVTVREKLDFDFSGYSA